MLIKLIIDKHILLFIDYNKTISHLTDFYVRAVFRDIITVNEDNYHCK